MYFIDVQGTLVSDKDKSPLKGAREFIKALNKKKIPYVIVTNNSKNANYAQTLISQGFEIDKNKYLDPLELLVQKKLSKACMFGPASFKEALKQLGIVEKSDAKDVVFTNWEGYEYEDFSKMLQNIKRNFIAMNATSIYMKNDKPYPGCGGICAMLEAISKIKIEVLGKPSSNFFANALSKICLQAKDARYDKISMISDDFRGDLQGAKALGMKIILVLSGKTSSLDMLKSSEISLLDASFAGVGEIIKKI